MRYDVLERIGMKVIRWEGGAPQPWPTATPQEVGLDGAALESRAARIEKGEIANISLQKAKGSRTSEIRR